MKTRLLRLAERLERHAAAVTRRHHEAAQSARTHAASQRALAGGVCERLAASRATLSSFICQAAADAISSGALRARAHTVAADEHEHAAMRASALRQRWAAVQRGMLRRVQRGATKSTWLD